MNSKFNLISLIVIVCIISIECWTPPKPKTHYIDQPIDHFNWQVKGTFKQRYLIHDTYFDSSKQRIFFYTGNEGDVMDFWEDSGFVFEAAQKFDALVVFAEHRYFGNSLPFGNNSWQTNTIGYLSIEQTLADYAVLCDQLFKRWELENPIVVAFGGSYGGILSAWFRMSYPHICSIALAASAPILECTGFGSKPTYFETTTNDFEQINSQCPQIVRDGFSLLLELGKTKQGLKQISEKFQLCQELKSDQLNHLIGWAVNSFAFMAMLDYPSPSGRPVDNACNLLIQYQSDPLTALAQACGVFYNDSSESCFDIFTEFVECADPTGCGLGPAAWSWDYLFCTEIYYLISTNNVTDMFPPIKWGVTPKAGWLATQYRGKKIEEASRIIFSNGLLDPWSGGGFLHTINPNLPAVLIPDSAHHLDLHHSDPLDPPFVVKARETELEFIQQWINEIEAENKEIIKH